MTAAVFDYAAIARRMNCDKPQKAEPDEVPKKKMVKKRPIVSCNDDDDEDE